MVRHVSEEQNSTVRLAIINRIAKTLLDLASDSTMSTDETIELFDHFKTVGNLIVNDLNLVVVKAEGPEVEARLIPIMP
jgi:hypothetical protein